MKNILGLCIFALMPMFSLADAPAISVENLRAQQRYHWNGKVDISFHVGTGDVATTEVILTSDYYMGLFEVTRQHYTTIMATDPTSKWNSEGIYAPVNTLTWDTVMATNGFIACVNHKIAESRSNARLQLPTEAQWEVATRAGTLTKWFMGETDEQLSTYAWWKGNDSVTATIQVHNVGTRQPNPWGIYDLYGNVNEFCRDYWVGTFPGGTDPESTTASWGRCLRGGSMHSDSSIVRSGFRTAANPSTESNWQTGFRVILTRP